MCQCHFVVIVMPVAFLGRFPVILSYVQKDATTPNIVGSTMSEDVAFVLVMVCKRMQQLPTIFGPAVHCGKDTTHETFLNTLILSWRVRGPNNVGRAVQTDPTLLRYVSTITEQKKCWELFAQKFNPFQTSRYSMQKSVQTDATCNTQQCCVRLHGAMRSLLFIVEEFVRVVNMLFIIETSAKVESGKLGAGSRVCSFPRAFQSSTDASVLLLSAKSA